MSMGTTSYIPEVRLHSLWSQVSADLRIAEARMLNQYSNIGVGYLHMLTWDCPSHKSLQYERQ